jgi:hypothetical protein
MLGSAAFTLPMSARATSSSAGVGRMAPIVAATPWSEPGHEFVAQFRVRTLHTNNQVNPGQREGFEKVQAFLVDS